MRGVGGGPPKPPASSGDAGGAKGAGAAKTGDAPGMSMTDSAMRSASSALTNQARSIAAGLAQGKFNESEAIEQFVHSVIQERFKELLKRKKKKKKKKKDDEQESDEPTLEEAVAELIQQDPELSRRFGEQFQKLARECLDGVEER